jgi:hypothetical protein
MTSTQISPSQKTSDNQAPAAGGALIQPSAKTGVLSSCSAPVVEQISPSQLQADNHLNFAGGALIQPSATELLMPKVRMPVVEQISPSHIKNENHERSAGGLNLDQTTTMTGSITKFQMSLSDPTLNTLAAQFSDIEQMRIATASRLRILTLDEADEDGVMRGWALPDNHPSVIALRYQFEAFEIQEKTMEKALAKQLKTHPLHPWIKSQIGLGDKQLARLLGVIRDPYWNELYQRPRTVSELWAYSGLHVIDGQGAKRRKGQQSNWSAEAKSRIYLIAVSCIKQCKSPYRAVYDDRRAHTANTHPDWTDGHSHNDAIRIMGKEILKQLWIQSRAIHEGE